MAVHFTVNQQDYRYSVAFNSRGLESHGDLSTKLFSEIVMPPNYRGPQLPIRSKQKFKSWLVEAWLVTILGLQPLGFLAIYWANKSIRQHHAKAIIAAQISAHKAATTVLVSLIISLLVGLGLIILFAGPL